MSLPPSRRLALAAAAWAVAASCRPEPPAPPERLRLWAEGTVRLVEAPAPPAARTVFAADFAGGLAGWQGIVNPGREPGPFEAAVVAEGERTVLELTGVHGGLHRVVPVEPDTCYVFSGATRANGVESDRAAFDGARFWLAEASAEAPFEEFRTTRSELMTASWTSPGAFGEPGWKELRHVFVTTPRTRFLHLVCSLATRANVSAGSVRFADVRLDRLSPEGFWREELARESAARARIDPPAGAQAARRVRAELGGESRPSLVLLPGDALRFSLPRWEAGARLLFGAGVWPPSRPAPGTRGTLRVSADGRVLLSQAFVAPEDPSEARWQPLELSLAAGAAELELTAGGEAPLVLGAPLVRAAATARPRTNLLLVSIDTLRADRVGAYGSARDTTPHLDRLARAGLVCRDASAPAPYTLPSHASLLTAQFPSVHGAVAHESTLSGARSTSLAELLARAGYATRAFTAGGFVNPVFGLDQGFEAFSEVDPIRERDSHYFRTLVRRHGVEAAGRLLEEQGFQGVERWLRTRGREPFFLFLHTYTVHDYDAPPAFQRCHQEECARPRVPLRTTTAEEAAAFTPAMRAHVQHLYDAALRYTDERLARLLAVLEELGLRDETLIVVTSDHGEEFFEHGALQHGRTLYEEVLRIPLVLAGPGIAPGTLDRPAMLVDVVPTVLARLGLPPAEHVQGLDLLGGPWPERAVWSEVASRFAHKYALRDEHGRKAILGPATEGVRFPNARALELYDLARDAREEHDLAPEDEAGAAAARERLERHRAALEELGRALGSAGAGELDEGTLAELDELGYGGE